ncbi:hypothetical protein HBI51_246980 [Parastagonospora nodorum]|nr:hypothetical protein HBI51_246980 [Parastagonospora nodorum]KAH5982448.1 hypothetical protein HBI84_250910 [Parastagonospora nodorum]
MKFYSTNYSANRMKLVVLGRESLDTLEEWVEEIFKKLPNKDLDQRRWEMPPYTENELLTQTFAKPVLDSRPSGSRQYSGAHQGQGMGERSPR